MKYTAALLALFLAFQNAVAEPVAIDGDFSDWDHKHIVAVDPAGDAEGAFDITRVWLQTHGSIVFLRFDTGRVLNIQSGPREEGTLQLRFTREKDGRAAELDLRRRSLRLIEASGGSTDIGWYAAGYRSAPTYASSEFELRIDLSVIDAGPGDRIKLSISGSDELDEPVRFELTEAGQTATNEDLTLDRAPGTAIRIASLNTWRNGMVDPERSAPLLRLLSGTAPDVIMLQEEYNTSLADVKAAIESKFEGE
ncbi:MAG: endonuclease/exonuclease/phosphatase family protein, partial [Phycisphaerales bacterium]